MRVVLAHDWLVGMRGGERVLEELCRLFPEAPILTLVHSPGSTSPVIESHSIRTSALNRLPGIARRYRHLLPLMPAAVAALKVPPCELLLSSSHAVIKGLRAPAGAKHLCYLHTPMRYAWDERRVYFEKGRVDPLTRMGAAVALPLIRKWDARTSARVDRFVCNSHFVAERARRAYGVSSAVVHPPVDLERFSPSPAAGREAPYLMVGAFAPYKRIETAIEAFRRLGRRLDVVGTGQEVDRLRDRFAGPVRWLGSLTDREVTEAYRRCRAFVLPAAEDFGIAPLEAQASGRPIIALGKGGALETVRPLEGERPTGILYPPTGDPVADLVAAIRTFEANEARFSSEDARAQAERFSPAAFRDGIRREIEALL